MEEFQDLKEIRIKIFVGKEPNVVHKVDNIYKNQYRQSKYLLTSLEAFDHFSL